MPLSCASTKRTSTRDGFGPLASAQGSGAARFEPISKPILILSRRELRIIGNALQAGDSNRSRLPSISTSAASRKPQGWVTGAVNRGIPRFEAGKPAAANAACNASTSSTRRQQLAMVIFGSIAGRGKNSIWRGPRSTISQPSSLNVEAEPPVEGGRGVEIAGWASRVLLRTSSCQPGLHVRPFLAIVPALKHSRSALRVTDNAQQCRRHIAQNSPMAFESFPFRGRPSPAHDASALDLRLLFFIDEPAPAGAGVSCRQATRNIALLQVSAKPKRNSTRRMPFDNSSTTTRVFSATRGARSVVTFSRPIGRRRSAPTDCLRARCCPTLRSVTPAFAAPARYRRLTSRPPPGRNR